MEPVGVPEALLARLALEVRVAVALVEGGEASRVLVSGAPGAAAVVGLLRGEALARGVVVERAPHGPSGVLVRRAPRLVARDAPAQWPRR